MNTYQLLQHCFLAVSLVGAAVCLAAVLAYCFRNQIRELHERWLGLGPLGRVVSILAVTVAVLYGGTKSPTNDPPDTVGGGSTNPPPMMCCSPRPRLSAPPQELITDNQQLTTLPAWHKRGAYSDWQRIDFPDGFAFPHGTNLLTSVTLFAYGEIRESLHQLTTNNQQLTTLPMAVSLEPNVSMVSYGLTSSNSFLIAWQNACVNRDATNRVDASIELFRNGAMATTVIPLSTPTPPTYTYIPAVPPPGYVGSGQDDTWALAAFPDDYDVITNKGYEAWLMEDYVGVNEQNGHVKMAVTINAMPQFGPCYLVCGPHKMIVPESGTYSFPLGVFGEYEVRTYPTDLPIDVEIDDGYSGPEPESPLMQSMSPRRRFASGTASWHKWLILPRLIVDPSSVPYESARNTEITLWKNTDGSEEVSISSFSGLSTMVLTGATSARILRAEINDAFEVTLSKDGYSVSNYVAIEPPPLDYHQHSCCSHCCGDYCECNGTCCDCRCDCWGYISNLTNETSRASQP